MSINDYNLPEELRNKVKSYLSHPNDSLSLLEGRELRYYLKAKFGIGVIEREACFDDSEMRMIAEVLSVLPGNFLCRLKEIEAVSCETLSCPKGWVNEAAIERGRIFLFTRDYPQQELKKPFRFGTMKSTILTPGLFARLIVHEIAHLYHHNMFEECNKVKIIKLYKNSGMDYENFSRYDGKTDEYEDFATMVDMWFKDSYALLERAIYNFQRGKPILLEKVLLVADVFSEYDEVYVYKISLSREGKPAISMKKAPIERGKNRKVTSIGPYKNFRRAKVSPPAVISHSKANQTLTISQRKRYLRVGNIIYDLKARKKHRYKKISKLRLKKEREGFIDYDDYGHRYPKDFLLDNAGVFVHLSRDLLEFYDIFSGKLLKKIQYSEKESPSTFFLPNTESPGFVWIMNGSNPVLVFMDLEGNIQKKLFLRDYISTAGSKPYAFGANGRFALVALVDNKSSRDYYKHDLLLVDLKEKIVVKNFGDTFVPEELNYAYSHRLVISKDGRFASILYRYPKAQFEEEEDLVIVDLNTQRILHQLFSETALDRRGLISSGGRVEEMYFNEEKNLIFLVYQLPYQSLKWVYVIDTKKAELTDIIFDHEPIADTAFSTDKLYYTFWDRIGVFAKTLPLILFGIFNSVIASSDFCYYLLFGLEI